LISSQKKGGVEMEVLKLIIEKGRICQWIAILGGTVVSIWLGLAGKIQADHIVEIMKWAFIVAGGVEFIKLLRGIEAG